MSQPFRYDWEAAKQRIMDAGEEPASFCLYCLPRAGVLLLNALLERADWEATYRVPGFDYEAHRDEIQDIVDDTENGLMTDCNDLLADLVTQVTNNVTNVVNNAITQITASEGSCCYLDEQPTIDPPPTTGDVPTGEERDNLCKAAQKAHDNGLLFLQNVFTLAGAGGAVSAGVVGAILALYLVSLPFALLGAVIAAIIAIVSDLSTDTVEQEWVDVKPDVVCAIYQSLTPGEAKAEVHSAIDNADISGIAKSLFKGLYNQAQINRIFEGDVGDTTGYSAGYCSDCGTIHFLFFDFNDGPQDWGGINAVHEFDAFGGHWKCRLNDTGGSRRIGIDTSTVLALTGNVTGQVNVKYMSAKFTNGTNINVAGNGISISTPHSLDGTPVTVSGQLFGDDDTDTLEFPAGTYEATGELCVQATMGTISQGGNAVYGYIDNITLVVEVT